MREGIRSSVLRLSLAVVRRLPAGMAYALADGIGRFTALRAGPGVRRLRANLERAGVPPVSLDILVRAGMISYLRYWVECIRLQDWTPEMIAGSVRVEGVEAVRAELDAGRGVVCGLAHQGNWDLAGAWATTHLKPVTTVAERLQDPHLFDGFLRFRQGLGMTVLTLGDAGVFTDLVRSVHAGALVPLLMDRDLSGTGVQVDLFGHPAGFAAGPAALAEATGAALFPVSITYETARVDTRTGPESGHRTVIVFHPPVPAPAGATRTERIRARTQACADALAARIATHPQDWHMLQRVFLEDARPPTHPGTAQPAPTSGAPS